MVGSAVIGLSLIACTATSPTKNTAGAGGIESSSPSPDATSPSPDAPVPTSTPTAKATTVKPTSTPTRTITPGACATHSGAKATLAQDLKLLNQAASHNIYIDSHFPLTGLDSSLNGKLPNVKVPVKLLKAIAAEESSWTSNCVSGDGLGGFGLMQMQAGATSDVNTHFNVNFDLHNQSTNVLLADGYLEWLTVRLGIKYFHGDFNLSTNKSLRDHVLAAYNTGVGVVDSPTGLYIGPTGAHYAQAVDYFLTYKPVQTQWGICPKYCK